MNSPVRLPKQNATVIAFLIGAAGVFSLVLIIQSFIYSWKQAEDDLYKNARRRIQSENRIISLSIESYIVNVHLLAAVMESHTSGMETGEYLCTFIRNAKHAHGAYAFTDDGTLLYSCVRTGDGISAVAAGGEDEYVLSEKCLMRIRNSPADVFIDRCQFRDNRSTQLGFLAPVNSPHHSPVIIAVVYNICSLTDAVSADHTPHTDQVLLLNKEGYRISSLRSTGNIMKVDPLHFPELYKGEWSRIMHGESGQFKTENGLFTFETVTLSSSLPKITVEESHTWKLVSRYRPSDLPTFWNSTTILLIGILAAIAAAGTGLALRYGLRELELLQKLRSSDRNFSTMSDTVKDAILFLGRDFVITYWSKSAERMFGYSSAEAKAKCLTDIISSPHLPSASGRFCLSEDTAIPDGKPLVAAGIRSDTTTFPCEIILNVPSDASLSGAIAVIRDITERKQLDSRILLLSKIINQAADIIFLTDAEYNIMYVNEAFTRITGYSPEDALGQNPRILKSGKMPDAYYSLAYDTLKIGTPFHQEVINKRKDGSLFHYDQTITPIKDEDGRITHFLSVGRDVTGQHETRRLLEQKSEQLRLFIKHSPAAIAMFDTDMRYLIASDRWYTDYGIGSVSIIGKSHYEVFPEIMEMPEWMEIHKRCLAGETIQNDRDHIIRTDGSMDWIRWELRPWYTVDGEIGGIIMFTEIITDTVKAEQELQEKETRFRTVINQASDTFFLMDSDARFVDCNIQAARSLGYTREEILQMSVPDIDPDFVPGNHIEKYWKPLKPGENLRFEVEHIRKDGTVIPNEVSFTTAFFDGAQYFMSVNRDITERKLAEAAIQENREKFKNLAESITDVFLAIDNDLTITYWNARTEEITGLSSEDVLGRKLEEILESRKSRKILPILLQCIRTRQPEKLVYRYADNGHNATFEVNINPTRSGVSVLARDITQELRYREILFQQAQLLNQISESVITCDLDGTIKTWNAGSTYLFGYTAAEMIGTSISFLYADSGPEYVQTGLIEPVLENGRYETEINTRTKEGKDFFGFLSLTTEKDEKGDTIGIIATAIDIGKRKQAEEELQVLNEQLEQRVQDRTAELEELYNRLKSRDKRLQLIKEVASAANAASDVDSALLEAVKKVCLYTGWPIGHVYYLSEKSELLQPSGLWYLDDPKRYADFMRETQQTVFTYGVGMPGAVLGRKSAVWIENVQTDETFIRRNICIQSGLHGAFGFPVIVNGAVVAVLEFFSHKPGLPVESLRDIMDEIGIQLGYVLERQQIEHELSKSEQRLKLAFEGGGFAWWDWDYSTGVITSDPLKCTMLGFPPGTASSDASWWFERIHTDDRESARLSVENLIAGRSDTYDAVFRVQKMEGTWLWVHDKGTVAENSGGTTIRIVGTTQDITPIKLAEEEIRRARSAAESSSKAKSVFLANMSHEIRTPLNAIIGFGQLLRQDASLGAEQKRRVETISKSGEHLLSLINDILEISKIEAGRVHLQNESFNLSLMLKELKAMFEIRCQQKGITLRFNRDQSLPDHIIADQKKLRQILTNLLSNAVKFTDSGGITVSVELQQYYEGKLIIKFSVSDTGIGIEEDALERIFNYFEQTETGARAAEGTGLGLAISKEFVNLMDGTMSVTSRVGAGSEFSFTVPVTTDESKQSDTSAERRITGIRADREIAVLIADDMDNNRDLLVSLLSDCGFQCATAVNGEETLAMMHRKRYDLLLLDLTMPVLNGYEVLDHIQSEEEHHGLKIMIITASITADTARLKNNPLVSAVMIKPFRNEKLLETIADIIDIEYRYDDETAKTGRLPSDARVLAASLPEELKHSLHRALIDGNRIQIIRNADDIREYSQDLFEIFMERITAYDYESLIDILQTKIT